MFFSATMAPEIERITNTFLSNPARIEVARQATTSDTIEQRLMFTPSRATMTAEKREMLRATITAEGRHAPTRSSSATARWMSTSSRNR
jgi:superfamily II DNA/RNA helicase